MDNRVPVAWVSGGWQAVVSCPRDEECGMVLPDALRPTAVVAERLPVIRLNGVCRVCGASPYRGECQCGGPADRERKYSEALARLADVDAGEYNDRVWSSPEMRVIGSLLRGAAGQLGEGKGWGLIALQTARLNLEAAVQIIAKMEGWATNGE